MKILRNYILKECLLPFFLALIVLSCVFMLGHLIKLAHLVINKGVSLMVVGKVFLLYIPVLFGYTLPISCLIGIIMGFSRLSADNEIIAIRSSGIYLKKFLPSLILIGIIFSLFSFLLNNQVIPYAYHEQRKIIKTIGVQNPTALLEPGVFIKAFNNQIIFIHRVEDNKLFHITIYQPQANGMTRTIFAREGEFTPIPGTEQIKLKLTEGTTDEADLKDPTKLYKLNFKTFFMNLDASQGEKEIDKKPKSMTLDELRREKDNLETLLIDTSRIETEYFRKITWSVAPLIFVLLGFPLAIITNKREKTANIILAVLASALYYLAAIGCEALSIEHVAPAAILMWIPNALGISAVLFLNHKLFKT